jgi:hypothetical protein
MFARFLFVIGVPAFLDGWSRLPPFLYLQVVGNLVGGSDTRAEGYQSTGVA